MTKASREQKLQIATNKKSNFGDKEVFFSFNQAVGGARSLAIKCEIYG
jgi:hypothetical protein